MNKSEAKIWKEGFDAGVRDTERLRGAAMRIGEAIIAVLDERYEFKKEDYD